MAWQRQMEVGLLGLGSDIWGSSHYLLSFTPPCPLSVPRLLQELQPPDFLLFQLSHHLPETSALGPDNPLPVHTCPEPGTQVGLNERLRILLKDKLTPAPLRPLSGIKPI